MLLPKLLCIFLYFLTISSLAQSTSIEKMKTKHLVGEWYSMDTLDIRKANQILTFSKKPAQELKDSTITYWKLGKKNAMKEIRRYKVERDTVIMDWTFIEQSKNINVVFTTTIDSVKVEVKFNALLGDDAPTHYTIDIKTIFTYHIISITEEKLVIKSIAVKK